MAKPSAYAKVIEREVNRRMQDYGRNRMQLAEDAAFIAAHEVLQLGPGRAKEFGEAFCKAVNQIAELVLDDSKGDKDLVYTKHVVDRQIKEIVGDENFVPFNERYGRA